MTWTNAFDVGPCTVMVTDNNVAQYFSGVLSKGQTSSAFNGKAGAGEQLNVSVTAEGAVQLNWISGTGPSTGYAVTVVPSYSIATASMRASGFNIPNGVTGDFGAAAYSSDNGDVFVALDGSGSTWTPDPADLTEAGIQTYWAVRMGVSA